MLAERAYRAGVKVFAGRPWFATEPPAPYLRLTFAGEPPDRLAEAVRILASAAPRAEPPQPRRASQENPRTASDGRPTRRPDREHDQRREVVARRPRR